MKHILKKLLSGLCLISVSMPAFGNELVDSLYLELEHASTPEDSIVVMGNLFDVLPRFNATQMGWKLYEVAERTQKDTIALEMIRSLANRSVRNDSILCDLYDRALKYPESPERTETLIFINLHRNVYHAYYASEKERDKLLRESLEKVTTNYPEDLGEQITLLHYICMMLGQSSVGDLLSSYLDQLGKLIEKLPENAFSIRNAFNVFASTSYIQNGEPQKAVKTDLELLEDIKGLEKYYAERGRKYRNYNGSKYVIYNRLLSSFTILPDVDVDKYYGLAMKYKDLDGAAMANYKSSRTPDIYYALYKKDYAKALDLLKNHIDAYESVDKKRILTKYMIECAEKVNDKETLLKASRDYNQMLEEYLAERSVEKYRELQVIYDLQEIKNHNAELTKEKRLTEEKWQRIFIIISSIALFILIISVIFLFILYRKNRELAQNRAAANKALTTESENLRRSRSELVRARDQAQKANTLKTDFIKNMSHEVSVPLQAINEYCKLLVDCSDTTNKKYLEHFANLVYLNSELLTTIINDVLRLSEIESSSMPIHRHVVHLNSICQTAIDSMRHRLKPGVEIKFTPQTPDVDIFTDPQRIQQILLNLLTNAAKFTDKGVITLDYKLDDNQIDVIFSVSDTGIGIKPENKEKIFERFVKLNGDTQGAGLGLTISRLIARLLGGDVTLDTTYTNGARFNLRLPKK